MNEFDKAMLEKLKTIKCLNCYEKEKIKSIIEEKTKK